MPIKSKDPNNTRSTALGAAPIVHAHDHSDLAGVTSDQHHAKDHASRHAPGGVDEVTIIAKQISDLVAEIFMHMGA